MRSYDEALEAAELLADRECTLDQHRKSRAPKKTIKHLKKRVKEAASEVGSDPLTHCLLREARVVVKSRRKRQHEVEQSPLGVLHDLITHLVYGSQPIEQVFNKLPLSKKDKDDFQKLWKRFNKSWINLGGKGKDGVKSKSLHHLRDLVGFCESFVANSNFSEIKDYSSAFIEQPTRLKH